MGHRPLTGARGSPWFGATPGFAPWLLGESTSAATDSRVLRLASLLWGMVALVGVLLVTLAAIVWIRRLGLRLRRPLRPPPRRVYPKPIPSEIPPVAPAPPKKRNRFPRSGRLTLNREFDAVFQARDSAAGARLILYGLRNDLGHGRLGLSVGRRYGSAVRRNRFKRLCREAFRLTQDRQPVGWDWIILPNTGRGKKQSHHSRKEPRPSPSSQRLRLAEVEREMLRLMRQIAERH